MGIKRKNPKIVLFNPHQCEGGGGTEQRLPLSLMAVGGFPERNGYDVVIIDASVRSNHRTLVLKECESALCFGTTSIIGYQAYHASEMAKEVKDKYPNLPIISGGWFPSVRPEMVIKQGGADVVVTGQGEFTFMELLEALRSKSPLKGIEGIVYKGGDEVFYNQPRKVQDMNKLPPMPYHLVNLEEYFNSDPFNAIKSNLHAATGKDFSGEKIRCLHYFSSYGCPNSCNFCCSPAVTGKRWTALKAGRIVDELSYLIKQNGFNVLIFDDANWGLDQKRVYHFCEGLLRKGIRLYWKATMESHILNKYNDAVLDIMAESGCCELLLGAEAAHPETLRILQKNIKPGDIEKSCEILSKRRIVPRVYFIVGYPGESRDSIRATIHKSCNIVCRYPMASLNVAFFIPLPGTPLNAKAKSKGYQEVKTIDGWKSLYSYRSEAYSFIGLKQSKTVKRCMRYYFPRASRPSMKIKLNIFDKLLNKTARIRLKYKILGFPIEFKLYHGFLRLPTIFKEKVNFLSK